MYDYGRRRSAGSFSSVVQVDAYLDIETSFEFKITVIGVFQKVRGFRQLMGQQVNRTNLLRLLKGVHRLVTYNGNCFDLPVIRRKLQADLREQFESYDLKFLCWQHQLYGGLKRVEQILGIRRRLTEMDGEEAMRLWYRYERDGDRHALRRLLEYNREDVMNLTTLRKKLENSL